MKKNAIFLSLWDDQLFFTSMEHYCLEGAAGINISLPFLRKCSLQYNIGGKKKLENDTSLGDPDIWTTSFHDIRHVRS